MTLIEMKEEAIQKLMCPTSLTIWLKVLTKYGNVATREKIQTTLMENLDEFQTAGDGEWRLVSQEEPQREESEQWWNK